MQTQDLSTQFSRAAWIKEISTKAVTADTVNLILETIRDYYNSPFVLRCVQEIKNSLPANYTEFDFARHAFLVIYKIVKYERDPDGIEIISTPLLLVKHRKGDCKKFTVWLAAVLKAAGYNPTIKVIDYGEGWEHVYVTLNNIIVDPVIEVYNKEATHKRSAVFNLTDNLNTIKMKLVQMGNLSGGAFSGGAFSGIGDAAAAFEDDVRGAAGMGCPMGLITAAEFQESLSGMGKWHLFSQKTRDKLAKIVDKAKGAGFTILRAAFLALIAAGKLLKETPIKVNIAEMVAKLWNKNPAVVKEIWTKFGGNPDDLRSALVAAGAPKLSGMGVIGLAAVSATAAAAAPIIVMLMKALKENKVVDESDPDHAALGEAVERGAADHNDDGSARHSLSITPHPAQPATHSILTVTDVNTGTTSTTTIPNQDLNTVTKQGGDIFVPFHFYTWFRSMMLCCMFTAALPAYAIIFKIIATLSLVMLILVISMHAVDRFDSKTKSGRSAWSNLLLSKGEKISAAWQFICYHRKNLFINLKYNHNGKI